MRGPNRHATSISRRLRSEQTFAERKLWLRLRDRRLNGFKFLRQVRVGSFVVDFLCREHRLIVEVDGATHSTEDEMKHDRWRDAELVRSGYRVLRIQNLDVYRSLDAACETILAELTTATDRPSSGPA